MTLFSMKLNCQSRRPFRGGKTAHCVQMVLSPTHKQNLDVVTLVKNNNRSCLN